MKSSDRNKTRNPGCTSGASITRLGELQIPLSLSFRGLSQRPLLPPAQTLHPVGRNLVENLVDPGLFGLLRGGPFLCSLHRPPVQLPPPRLIFHMQAR